MRTKSNYKAVEKFLKKCMKDKPYHQIFHGVYWNETARRSVVCDGYSVFELNERFKDLETENALKDFNYKRLYFEDTCAYLDIDVLIPEFKQVSKVKNEYCVLNLNGMKIGVDPKRFLLAIDLLGLKGTIKVEYTSPISPLIFENAAGEIALLLPVKIKDPESKCFR